MCLCGVFPCRARLPLFCVMVLVIDALENNREPQARGLTGANTAIIHPAAACLVFDCGAAAGQQPGISARTVSPLDATVHRNRPRFVLISPLSHSCENALQFCNSPDARDIPARTDGCAATGEPRTAAVRPNNARAPVIVLSSASTLVNLTLAVLSGTGCVLRCILVYEYPQIFLVYEYPQIFGHINWELLGKQNERQLGKICTEIEK